MAFELDIGRIVDEIIDLPDVRAAIDSSGNTLNEDYLRQRLLQRGEVICSEATSPIEAARKADQDLDKAIAAQKEALSGKPSFFYVTRWAMILALLGYFAFFVLRFLPSALGRSPLDWIVGLQWLIPALLLLPVAAFGLVRLRWRRWDLPAIGEKAGLEVEKALSQQTTVRSAARQAGLEAAQRSAFELINEATTRFYQDRLFVFSEPSRDAPSGKRKTTGLGLAEGLTSVTAVTTDVRTELGRIFRTMPSASIGIAGPRGIGKTSLLWSLCHSGIEGVDRKKTVAVYTAAPVEYDGRDFLLHIFSGLCRKVLAARNAEEIRTPFNDREMEQIKSASDAFIWYGRLGRLLLTFGMAAVFLGGILAYVLATLALSDVSSTSQAAKGASQSPSFSRSIVSAMDFKAGPLLQWGFLAALTGAGLILGAPIFNRRRPGRAQHDDALVDRARSSLADLNFQRNYSSGWSGALKLPVGVDLGSTMGLQIAQKQKSLPELADDFRQFVEFVTHQQTSNSFQTVIVAIDELDKMKSAEAAQQFLNEIKMIFTISRCFFFVSVSENALSTFERRGLSVRDAFDSAFDDIRYIDYLDLAGARRILFRRVLNLPGQYYGLCHVLSGGLPRDLIRVTRALLEIAEKDPQQNDIRELAGHAIRTEVQNKVRAAAIAARNVAIEPEVPNFLRRLAELDQTSLDSPDAVEQYVMKPPAERKGMSEAEKAARQSLLVLYRELDAFFYYALTAYALFRLDRTDGEWLRAEADDGWISRLARARQAMDLGADISVFRTSEVRRNNGLKVPAHFRGVAAVRLPKTGGRRGTIAG